MTSEEPSDSSEYQSLKRQMKEAQQTALREQLAALKQVRDRLTELLTRTNDAAEITQLSQALLKVLRAERRTVRLVSEVRYLWPMEIGAGCGDDQEESISPDEPVFCAACDAYYDYSCPIHNPGNLYGEEPSEWMGNSE
jgi:hypothetical protein